MYSFYLYIHNMLCFNNIIWDAFITYNVLCMPKNLYVRVCGEK